MFNRISPENNNVLASLEELAMQGENMQHHIKYETPTAICELYIAITHKPATDTAKKRKNEFYKSLADRALAEHGSLEAAYEALDRMTLLLQLENRMGNVRHKYPALEKHEIVELFYEMAMGRGLS